MIELIHKYLNKETKKVVPDNEYDPTPRIKRTVQPDVRLSFNETFENINNQLKLKL